VAYTDGSGALRGETRNDEEPVNFGVRSGTG
jgi:hypothetical protein